MGHKRPMNIYEFSNYREFLKQELVDRINDNPKYSLRAMAKRFEMGASTLSEVLSGRTNLSATSARRIAEKLKLKSKESSYLLELVELEATKDPEMKAAVLERIRVLHPKKRHTQDLSVELFRQMSEWFHSAILELPAIPGFDFQADNIARTLGISKPQAEIAVDRLLKLGLLEEQDGKIIRTPQDYRVQSEVRNAAMRNYYRQMLSQISDSLETQSPQERLSGYLNLALDPRALPEVDQAIDRLFQDIKSIAAKYTEPTTVYHLNLHFINLTKKERSL